MCQRTTVVGRSQGAEVGTNLGKEFDSITAIPSCMHGSSFIADLAHEVILQTQAEAEEHFPKAEAALLSTGSLLFSSRNWTPLVHWFKPTSSAFVVLSEVEDSIFHQQCV